jgi:hypothetical protein
MASHMWAIWRRKNIFPAPRTEPRFICIPARSLIPVPIVLSRFPLPHNSVHKIPNKYFADQCVHFRSVYTSPLWLHVKQPLLWVKIGNVALFSILDY